MKDRRIHHETQCVTKSSRSSIRSFVLIVAVISLLIANTQGVKNQDGRDAFPSPIQIYAAPFDSQHPTGDSCAGDGVPRETTPTTAPIKNPTRWAMKPKKGRVSLQFGRSASIRSIEDTHRPISNQHPEQQQAAAAAQEDTSILIIDPTSALRLLPLIATTITATSSAFLGTLRLLAPLIVARRAIVAVGNIIVDYFRGRYFRHTYTRVERAYLRYYEAPAALRALARVGSEIVALFSISAVMGWMVGIGHKPCRTQGRGLAFFCGVLWIGTVLGTGHAYSTAISVWGGPLKVQATKYSRRRMKKRDMAAKLFHRPWHILQWMKYPDQWIAMISERQVVKEFNTPAIIFPATWVPLRFLQICAMAKILSTEPSDYSYPSSEINRVPRLIRQFYIQMSLGDEWCRVVIGEKRVGLGVFIMLIHFIAMITCVVTSAKTNIAASGFMIPSVLAIIISGWMNIVIFWNRMEVRSKQAALDAISQIGGGASSSIGASSLGY